MQKKNIKRWFLSICFVVPISIAHSNPVATFPAERYIPTSCFVINNLHYENSTVLFFKDALLSKTNNGNKKYDYQLKDSLPRKNKQLVVIPFEYKQSALYQPFTFKAIDSVISSIHIF